MTMKWLSVAGLVLMNILLWRLFRDRRPWLREIGCS
jgi:hypothetical protein